MNTMRPFTFEAAKSLSMQSIHAPEANRPALPLRKLVCALIVSALACAGGTRALGGGSSVPLMDMSLAQLGDVEIKTSVASVRAKSLEEQPGIVSVITAREIHNTGARDLSDLLLRVPGYSLNTDVESMIGLMFRGMQGQEGKALLIVDGIEVNEPLYGSLPILNHIPADMIEQVEIIRGPGSAAYGGSAGLSVIRVTTKGAAQNGGYAVATPSFSEGHFSDSFAAGAGFTRGDWRYSFNAAFTDANLSNQTYTSPVGQSIQLGRNSRVHPWLVDVDAGWKALDLRVIYDAYQYNDSIDYGETVTTPNETHFDSLLASLKYDLSAASWLKITPQLTYRRQVPWFVNRPAGKYDIVANRFQGDLTAVAEFGGNSDLMVGFRWVRDEVHALDTSYYGQNAASYYGGTSHVAYTDTAGFVQYDLDTSWVNVSIGGRYEFHPAVGGAFVPRVALTRAWDQFHLKALFTQAFRIPAINVILESVGPKLHAEKTSNYEIEAGYKFHNGLSWTGNLFDLKIERPIIFFTSADGANTEGYRNGGRISSSGLETELKWDRPVFSTLLNYSFYQARDNREAYLRGDSQRFLGAPTHKVAWSGTWHVQRNFDVNVNGYWMSQRLAYTYPTGGIAGIPSEFIVNTYFEYRLDRLSFGVGGVDLFSVKRYAPQPYAGGTGPVPLMTREIFVKLGYGF